MKKPSKQSLAIYGKAWADHSGYKKVKTGIITKRGVVFKDYAEIGKSLYEQGYIIREEKNADKSKN